MTHSPAPASVVTARAVVCTLGGLLVLGAGAVSLLLLGFSAMCTDDGDTSDCAGAVAFAFSPIGAVLPTAVAAIVVVCRARRAGTAWGWGLGLLAAGLLVPAVAFAFLTA
ncbi:hypothetical protein [Amycolatopsis saalfeldensis]|uniref:Uncharacterized protein n=1 Tax=Amycolatopsis saalfeldensis TaxID=394193 RepID=A0A1H8WHF5_9PSEU|nr:hypothetical protein [Amycolatopsis saalfeldensis]SEP27114.1 hypothetical protein SAMN04489732_105197 [Amycolatopsis saalfeldensis]